MIVIVVMYSSASEDGVVQLSEFPNESRRALAHFVSLGELSLAYVLLRCRRRFNVCFSFLVPFIEDCMIFDGKMDVWTSSSDLLYLRAGKLHSFAWTNSIQTLTRQYFMSHR